MPRLVAPTTLLDPLEWNATLREGDTVEAVKKLKERPGKDPLICGSGALVNTLNQRGSIDVLRLVPCPLALPGR